MCVCLQTLKVKTLSAPFVPFLRANQHPCQIQCDDEEKFTRKFYK